MKIVMKRILPGLVISLVGIILVLLTIREIKGYIIMQEAKALEANGGISEMVKVTIGGIDQYLLIEGQDVDNPVCLFIHGGPGAPFPFGVSARTLFPEVTESCTAVFYDQRGAGKSYSKEIDVETMTVSQFVSDANEITDYVREKLGQDKIHVIGFSFGTVIGANLVHQYPEKFHSYIGVAQLTNVVEGQRLAIEWLKEEAEAESDAKTLSILNEMGMPPFFDDHEAALGDLLNKYPGYNYSDDTIDEVNLLGLVKGAFFSPDYTLADIYKALISGVNFSLFDSKELQEEVIRTNLFETIPEYELPVYFVQGVHDKVANFDLAKNYYEYTEAPKGKKFIALQHSAHYQNEQYDFELFIDVIKEAVQ